MKTQTSASKREPPPLSDDARMMADYTYRNALSAFPGLAAIFGPIIYWVFDAPPVGSAVMVAGALLFLFVLWVGRSALAHETAWMMRIGCALIVYVQAVFLACTFAALYVFTDGVVTVAASGLVATFTYLYTRYYVRLNERRWQERRYRNENEVLDLDEGTYPINGAPFHYGPWKTLGWEGPFIRAIGWAGPAGAAVAGIMLNRHTESGGLLVMAVLGLGMGVGLADTVARAVVSYRKIRHYERELGCTIYNR